MAMAFEESIFALVAKQQQESLTEREEGKNERTFRGQQLHQKKEEEEEEKEKKNTEQEKGTRKNMTTSFASYSSIHSGVITPSHFPTFCVNKKRPATTFGRQRNALKPIPRIFQRKGGSGRKPFFHLKILF